MCTYNASMRSDSGLVTPGCSGSPVYVNIYMFIYTYMYVYI